MITRPTLILDEKRCRRNIETMAAKASANNVDFRPHFKTHQSLGIGRWFKDVGVDKITVSSLAMAEYFSEEWDDVTVAFPANIAEIATIDRLAGKIRLNLLVESVFTAGFLADSLKHKAGFFIKIDVGYHRTGLNPADLAQIDQILRITERNGMLDFNGFLAHAGHSYAARSKSEILAIHRSSIDQLMPLRNLYRREYPDLIISIGDTPTCGVADDFSMFDEIRPGNFVFYDLSQHQIGSCGIDRIAVALACPIVAIHANRGEIVIYGGGVHFSKERLEDETHGTIYGKVAQKRNGSWGDLIPDMFVKHLSQEHGIVAVPDSEIAKYRVGDHLMILPVHSCMTASSIGSYLTTRLEAVPAFRYA